MRCSSMAPSLRRNAGSPFRHGRLRERHSRHQAKAMKPCKSTSRMLTAMEYQPQRTIFIAISTGSVQR